MLYRRPFSVILEEAVEGETTEVTEVVEPLEGEELVEAVEEATELECEITEDAGDVEEALEEVDALEEQAAATDEVLAKTEDETPETPDEASAITEEQVVTAEESFKWSLAKLGLASGYSKVVTTAQEAVAEKKSRRERLKICNEGVKETVAKIIRGIVNMIKQIISRITIFVKKVSAKFFNNSKSILENGEKLEKIDKIDPVKFKESVQGKFNKIIKAFPNFETCRLLSSSDFKSLVDVCENAVKSKDVAGKLIKVVLSEKSGEDNKTLLQKITGIARINKNDKLYKNIDAVLSNSEVSGNIGAGEFEADDVIILGGTKILFVSPEGNKIEKSSVVMKEPTFSLFKADGDKLLESAKATYKAFANKFPKEYNVVADAVIKTQKDAIAALEAYEKNNKVEGFSNTYAVRSIKGIAIDYSMILLDSYSSAVRTYGAGIKALVKAATEGPAEEKKEEESK